MIFFQINIESVVFITSLTIIATISTFIYSMSAIFQINANLKHVFFNDVTIYDENVIDLANLIDSFQNVFQNFDTIVDISKKK